MSNFISAQDVTFNPSRRHNDVQFNRCTYGSLKQSKILATHWDGDWESFKQKFEATADLNGLNKAVTVGQLLAEDKIT